MFDLDRYLARIGLSGAPSIAAIHRAHATTIPFENLQPRSGQPVSLDADDLERKLVLEGRGGYCFEQNLLLATATPVDWPDVPRLLAEGFGLTGFTVEDERIVRA